jgi:hypothetical protein
LHFHCNIVGGIQYLIITRPDISFAINCHSPRDTHWPAVKRILRYVHHTTTIALHLRRVSSGLLSAFSGADWASSLDDRRSIGGYVVFFAPRLITRSVRKQATEAENKAVANAIFT